MRIRNLRYIRHINAVLAAGHQIVARGIMNRGIPLKQLVQAHRWVALNDGVADVARFDHIEFVAFRVVVGWTDGAGAVFGHAVCAARVHVVTAWFVDYWVELEESVGCDAVGCCDGFASAAGYEEGFGAALDEGWTGPVPFND